MIFATGLPQIKTFLRPARLRASTQSLLVRLLAVLCCPAGRPSAAAAAQAIRSERRHRAAIVRFLARRQWSRDWSVLSAVADLLLQAETRRDGRWLFIVDQTYVGQQGQKTENTFSRANYRRRPKKSNRKQKKYAKRSCHGFVCGLLLTPSGFRIPCCRSYYTEGYCQAQKRPYRTQIQLAAELIRDVRVPTGAEVVVLGDTAFEAKEIRQACDKRHFLWVVPINPERVLAGPTPRPKVASLTQELSAEHFEPVRLLPGQGAYAAQQRAARCRVGPKAKARTFWVHTERRAVHNIGDVHLVFSTKEQPHAGQAVQVQKILVSNALRWSAAEVVQTYALRWQIELFFKEMKGTLGLHRYRFRQFTKVENWVQAALVAFVYLEWYRAQQLACSDLPEVQRRWWQDQRIWGVRQVLTEDVVEHDLAQAYRWMRTPTGRRKLRRALRHALPSEPGPEPQKTRRKAG